ncbi:hypothetical protein D3C86_1506190 [compost metagenome]
MVGCVAEGVAVTVAPDPAKAGVATSVGPDLIGFASWLIESPRGLKSEPGGHISDVVIPAQHEIEAYKNSAGAVVLKMDAGGAYDEDQVVVIRPENVDAVVAAMLRVKAEEMA